MTDTAAPPATDGRADRPSGDARQSEEAGAATSAAAGAAGRLASSPAARRWLARMAVVVLLGAMGLQLAAAVRHDSATYDEPVNVRSGLLYALDHDLTPNPDHPPLIKALGGWAIRLLRDDPRRDLRSFTEIYFPAAPQYGKRALADDARAQGAIRAARVPSVLLTVALGLVVYAFARDLFGRLAGVVSLAAYAFSPELVGHGHLATNDLPAAGFVLLASWCLLRALRQPEPDVRRRWLVGAGLALGGGLASKYQVLLYVPAVAAGAGFVAWRTLPPGLGRRALAARIARWVGLVVGLAVAVVWAVTAAVDPHALLHAPPTGFGDGDTSLVARVIGWLPLPAVYRAGLRYQNAYSRVPKVGFLQGQAYLGHRWWYDPVVLSMKYPLVVIGLWAAGIVVVVRRRRLVAAVLVLLPAALVLGLGMAKAADIGDRYVIGTPLLLAVVAGAPFAARRSSAPVGKGRPRYLRPAAVRMGAAVAVVALLGAVALGARGHELAYVNRAWGGTGHAYQLVSDSAVDWGQDLGALSTWLRRNARGRPVYLDYFGTSAPAGFGIEAVPVDAVQAAEVQDGFVAVSATEYNRNRGRLAVLGDPVAVVGGSILVFERHLVPGA